MDESPRRPTPRPGLDWRTLPIGPKEAFVLSRLDGLAGVSQIAITTGLGEGDVEEILDRLESLGAVSFRHEGYRSPPAIAPPPPSPAPPSPPRASPYPSPSISAPPPHSSASSPPANPASASRDSILDLKPRAPAYDVSLLDEPADLDRATKEKILELEALLPRATHYELLGVPEDAEKAAIKRAYFTLIQQFHTDRFYGKNLGIFRSKLERISSALTKAQDTLSRAKTRAEYDQYLASRRETHGVRDSLPPTGAPPRSGDADSSDNPSIPRAPAAPAFEPAELAGSVPTIPSPSHASEVNSERISADPITGRRLLARKLGYRSGEGRSENPSSLPPSDPETTRERVARELKDRFDARAESQASAAAYYVSMANSARESKDYPSYVNALRIAASLAPDDVAIRDALTQASIEADRELADKFVQQAQYEQRDGYYERAARSYERAARGKESAGLLADAARYYHEAAICAAKEGASLKKVAELARRAVAANGKKVEYRLDLARAYEKLGMRSSAQGEVQRALELEPDNEVARALQKQLR